MNLSIQVHFDHPNHSILIDRVHYLHMNRLENLLKKEIKYCKNYIPVKTRVWSSLTHIWMIILSIGTLWNVFLSFPSLNPNWPQWLLPQEYKIPFSDEKSFIHKNNLPNKMNECPSPHWIIGYLHLRSSKK